MAELSRGVDVASYQRNIDWHAARGGGISFAYAKITEGVGYVDPLAGTHLREARDAGLVVGAYHYARPDTNPAEADAAHFAAQLAEHDAAAPGRLPPCLDMEQSAPVNMVAWTQRCIDSLRQRTGYGPVMIYANTSWWHNQLGGGTWLDDQTYAWVAHYGREPGEPGYRSDRTVMHQYTSTGRIPGYDGDIDVNLCWEDLTLLTRGEAPSGPGAPPDDRADGWWTVQAGQTLSSIGAAVGIAWQDLAGWNALPDPDLIVVGQRLRLTPPAEGGTGGNAGGTYTVRPGDTLSGIAATLGTTWQALYELNRGLIADPDAIRVGWVLAIPGAAPQEERYEVREGDTLSGIAEGLGVPGGWDALYRANRDVLDDPDVIRPGWVLRIPR